MKRLWIYCMVFSLVWACEDPYKNSTFQVYDVNPISTYLNAHPEKFSEWVAILNRADLYNALNQANEKYTAFVPTNEAVKAFLKEQGVASIETMDVEYARELVKYHVINDTINREVFINGGKLPTPTVSDNYLIVTFDEQGGANSMMINKEASVLEMAEDSIVSNGYIYVLGGVMKPLIETVYTRLANNDHYSIFREAVERSGWKERLDTPYDTTYGASGEMVITKRNFTLFAVTNEVFAKDGITDFHSLTSKLNTVGTDYMDEDNALKKYVGYHILSGAAYMEDLYNIPKDANISTWSTNAKDEVFQVYMPDIDVYYLSYDIETGKYAQLVDNRMDIAAKNGVLHEVDYYMPVSYPQSSTLVWDLTDYGDVATYTDEQLRKENSDGGFQVVRKDEQKVRLDVSAVTSYTYKQMSNKHTGHPGVVNYFVAKAGSVWVSGTNSDCLAVNPGYMGWVQMQTPTIIRGKYKVELQLWYATSQNFMRTGNSPMKVSFDGENAKEVAPYNTTTVPSSTLGFYTYVLWDEVEFEGTQSHSFKLICLDPLAATNSNYRIYIDHIKFIPIND